MVNETTEQVQTQEQQLEQKAREYLELLQPVIQELGIQVQVELCHSEQEVTVGKVSAAHAGNSFVLFIPANYLEEGVQGFF